MFGVKKFQVLTIIKLSLLLLISFVPKNASASDALLVGDSLAYQLIPALKSEGKQNNVSISGHAVGGTNTKEWADSDMLKMACKKNSPKIVLISLGTNDIPIKKEFNKHSARLVLQARKNCGNAKIVWLLPPKMPFNLDFLKTGVVNSGVNMIIETKYNLAREKDRVHLTIISNKIWAADILNQIKFML